MSSALLIVDVQNDFCPGGALPVPRGDEVVAVLNAYIQIFQENNFPILASRDWHPRKTNHFKEFGGIWPVHCVHHTPGAQFHPDLKLPVESIIISKGMSEDQDGYSAFEGVNKTGISLIKILEECAVTQLYAGGLATDYCIKASCLDALKNNIDVFLLQDAIRGVNSNPDDAKNAIKVMTELGAKITNLEKLNI